MMFSGRNARFEEGLGTAVDDRSSHSLGTCRSVRDLREQVISRCSSGTNIPSESWLQLQF